jgi:ubiquitin C-terminal hydrolase
MMMPPKVLQEFLENHPAGGVPTWLLEVGLDTVISLASLSHYYWYGGGSMDSPFLPTTAKPNANVNKAAWNKQQQDLALYISGRSAIGFISAILSPEPVPEQAVSPTNGVSPNNQKSNSSSSGSYPSTPTTPTRKTNTLGFKRRGSNHNETAPEGSDEVKFESDVMQRLTQQRNQQLPSMSKTESNIFLLDDFCSGSERSHFLAEGSSWLRQHPQGSSASLMNILEFYEFAEVALSDDCLKAIMYRIFAHGWIPNPSMERTMVQARWREWQESSEALVSWSQSLDQSAEGSVEIISQSIRKFLSENGDGNGNSKKNKAKIARTRKVFGGLGGFDGRGGVGYGVMYCINRTWWEQWEAYVGWSWAGDNYNNASVSFNGPTSRSSRPRELSSEPLLDRLDDQIVPGTLGSYEWMKEDLKKDEHYVLVPPRVWDVLYEIYGGGPPLPRMVDTPERKGAKVGASEAAIELNAPSELDLDAMASTSNEDRVLRVPRLMEVVTHPWILHVHLCDPQQPYRRGDAGPMSIRVMVHPDQPLWRFYAEIIVRLPFHLYKVYGIDGRGKARLWKRIDPNGPKDPASRYGPWTLLCKSRFALLPSQHIDEEMDEHYDLLKENWEAFTDHATVESSGLVNGSQVMAECAVVNKSGEMTWPREAAAKAGRVRRIAEKDMQFRRLLRGLDGAGKPLPSPPELVGLSVDAMDATGRWYEVNITNVQTVAATDTEEDDDSVDDLPPSYNGRKDGERQEVRVDFTRHGGHPEWIDIESDRLAAAGRFTLGNDDDTTDGPSNPTLAPSASTDTKTKGQPTIKKAVPDTDGNGKMCTLPGYGACGLTNLGNTCYINSAIQCMGYMPMLRSYLLSAEYKATGDLNKENPLGTNGKLLEEFADLIRLVWSAKAGEKAPTRFRSQLAKINPQFAGADQQDAQEFLNYMLDVLHEDSNRILRKPYVEDLEDDWVNQNNLLRVGEESWRRWLRRNRSIMADVAHGQILSTVTCPSCRFSSRKFDPFNLVSVPFPTVAEVIFKCYIYRRATARNTPWILNKPKKTSKQRIRFTLRDLQSDPKPPSEQLIVEEYVITMSRLADSSDLKTKIQQLCGIPSAELKICRAEEVVQNDKDEDTVVRRKTQITPLTDKEGPCSTLARQRTKSEDLSATPAAPSLIVAFQTTVQQRPREDGSEDGSDDSLEEEEEEGDSDLLQLSKKEERELEKLVLQYGNAQECRLYDTEMLPIAKAVSKSLWPTKEDELKLGLRVDAIDQKDCWFPGSVVEILESGPSKEESKDDAGGHKIKVRVHFDNFSNKWDEMKTIDDFTAGRVRPLFSHAVAKTKPTEFLVHHRYTDRVTRASNLFGQSFYVQCHTEWSTARAGAQILAQASRFLRQGPMAPGPIDIDGAQERQAKIDRLYDRTQAVISDLIDLLVDADREFILNALGVAAETNEDGSKVERRFRNPSYDASNISAALVKRVNALLLRLPFEVRVCQEGSPLGSNDESAYPFSLLRTIGNFMTVRYTVILQWREPPSDKKAANSSPSGKPSNYLGAPVMYVPPKVVMDEASSEILKTAMNQRAKKSATARGSGGLPLGVCLTEFCKVQELSLDDNWRCPRCKEFRKGRQNLVLWRLPDILTIHIKRFHCSSRWREKITTKVNFPLTGLDMREWCHDESPVFKDETGESYVYDLIGVINHYGGMTGGHYVATCKATTCSRDGREEVAFDFNGVGTNMPLNMDDDSDVQTGWKFGRQKVEVNQNKATAASAARAAADSAEPLWLQFDDDIVEPIPPRHVVSETAYVLFYRRRRLAPSNVARYSTLD